MRSATLLWATIFGLLACLALLEITSLAPRGYDIAVAGAPYLIGTREVARVSMAPIANGKAGTFADLPLDRTPGEGAPITRVRLPVAGAYSIEVTWQDATSSRRYVQVQPIRTLVFSAGLFLALVLCLPYALKGGGGAWYALLSEHSGGYSLARVQLIVWFLPTATLYGALAFTSQRFVDITAQIAVLLGLSGVTTLLGTATSPPESQLPGPEVPANLQDLVSDWTSQPDVSRYQCLFLSLIGATVMVASFWHQLELPEIPAAFMYLLAGSQGTYVATKAVKATKSGAVTVPSGHATVIKTDA